MNSEVYYKVLIPKGGQPDHILMAISATNNISDDGLLKQRDNADIKEYDIYTGWTVNNEIPFILNYDLENKKE
jgi:hypothetical protein